MQNFWNIPIIREEITSIILEQNPSQKEDILVWEENKTVHISGKSGVKAPENCDRLFAGFCNVKKIDFGNCFDTKDVTSMKFMFDGCKNLEQLNVSTFDTSNVLYMNGMFFNCSSLEQLDVSTFDTRKVESMHSMFSGCSGLKQLNVSGLDTRNVQNMCGMFSGCMNVQELDVTSFQTGKVTDMGGMFAGCFHLGNLDVSRFDTSNVKYMDRMFFNCFCLDTIDTRNFKKRPDVRDKDMFSGCENIKSTLMKGTHEDTVFGSTLKKSAIEQIHFIDKIENLPDNAWDISNTQNGSVMAWERKGILHICGKGFIEAPEDSSYLFAGYENLTTIHWGEHADEGPCFITHAVKNMSYMFKNCTSLSNLDVSHFDTDRVLMVNGMFSGCKSLSQLKLCIVRKGVEAKGVVDGCPMNTKLSWMFRKKEND